MKTPNEKRTWVRDRLRSFTIGKYVKDMDIYGADSRELLVDKR